VKLAGVITRIGEQRRRKDRVSIFIDGEFAFGLHLSVLAKLNLRKGQRLTKAESRRILFQEEMGVAREKAFAMLAARALSEAELQGKLLGKGFEEIVVSGIADELKASGYIDDASYAASYARNRLKKHPIGARLLRQELWQKGIDETLIDKTISEVFSDFKEEDLAREVIDKRASRYHKLSEPKRRKRLYDLLLRRGFDWEIARETLEQVNKPES
jgi:regulatory protein